MGKYLITQSLLGAYLYIFDVDEDYKEEAYKSFLQTLNREPSETTEVQQRGIDFEDAVHDYTQNKEREFDDCVKEIGEIVKGGQWQVRAYKDVTIEGLNFLLYAKCDVVKCGVIYDVKRVTKYEVGKYQNSPQHPMYLTCVPNANKFVYLICDGKDVYNEAYVREYTRDIESIIKDFLKFLRDENLLGVYLEKWVA